MKKMKRSLLLLLALCLLAGCGSGNTQPETPGDPAPPPAEEQQPPRPDTPPAEEQEGGEQPILLDYLAVEVVVEWDDSERILGELSRIQQLLRDGLAARSCQVEEISVTISTAGGFTANALLDGGVDLAFMPAVDYLACEAGAAAVLVSGEAPGQTVVAVATGREELGEAFRAALTDALLDTGEGQALLETYRAGMTCLPATEEAIQAVRDSAARQESSGEES